MTVSVTDGRARRRTNVADAATWENDVWADCTSRKSGSDTVPVSSRPLYGVTMTATRSGWWMPRPRRNTASTIEYTAVVIATPAASERIAKIVKRGVARSRLSASLMSRPTAVEVSTRGYRPITTLKPPPRRSALRRRRPPRNTDVENIDLISGSAWLTGVEKAVAREVGAETILRRALESCRRRGTM